MSRKMLSILVLSAMLPVLVGCTQVSALPLIGESEAPSLTGGGGGGVVISNGQFTEGLVAVGTGMASAEPEVAEVTLGVELRGDDPAALVNDGAETIDDIIAAAQELGVAEDDILTIGYNLWVETVYDPERGVPTGEVIYHLSHFIKLTQRDLSQVGQLLSASANAGANTISGVNFTVEEPEVLVDEARQLALQDAQTRAEQMAEGLGIELDTPILVMEIGGGFPYPAGGVGGGGMAESAAPSISPGSFSVSVSVQIVYDIR